MNTTHALIEAIKAGEDAKVKELIASDPASVNGRNERGETPVLAAAYRLRTDIIELLLAAGAETDIYEASAIGRLDEVKSLAAVRPELVDTWSPDGFTPLGLAAFFGHEEVVAFLLANGAEVNVVSQNDFKVMPLHSAVAARHAEVAEMLLKRGADVSATQEGGYTPLHSAANNGQEEIVRLLLSYGASINAKNPEGVTPLRLAEERGHKMVAELLRQRGATL